MVNKPKDVEWIVWWLLVLAVAAGIELSTIINALVYSSLKLLRVIHG